MTKEEILEKFGPDRARIEACHEMMRPEEPQKRIAILVCKKATQSCTANTCFWAFQNKVRHFEQYKDSPVPVNVCALFPCNGCDCDYKTDKGMRKKMERLILEDVVKIHLGKCIVNECPQIDRLTDLIEEYGFEWELGTH